MAGSLRDQLVKAGLATTDQAKKAERQTRAEKHAQRRGGAQSATGSQTAPGAATGKAGSKPATDPAAAGARERVRQQQAEKVQRDRALARAANEKAAAKALRAALKQIISKNDQRARAANEDDVAYNFVHGKKIKRIYVPAAQRDQLSAGNLVIVNDDGRYHLVSKSVAEQISARDPKRIIAAHSSKPIADEPAEPGPNDEFYARFQVPDDLDW